MIPLYDVIPSRTTPIVTVGLVVVNVLMFLFELSQGDSVDRVFMSYGLIPAEFSLATLATSMFLHGGFVHVGEHRALKVQCEILIVGQVQAAGIVLRANE